MSVLAPTSLTPIVRKPRVTSTLTVFPCGRTRFVSVPQYQGNRGRQSPPARLGINTHASTADSAPSGEKGENARNAHLALNKISHRLKTGYGIKAKKRPEFRPQARSIVKSRAAALEQHYGREKCHFATLTLPGSGVPVMDAMARWSSELARRVSQWLQRHWGLSDGTHQAVWVWEQQHRGALHLHMLCVLESPSAIELFTESLRLFWYALLSETSEKAGIDLFAKSPSFSWRDRWDEISDRAVDVVQVEKSVAGYLSKYISKGSSPKNSTADSYHHRNIYPAQWWGCTDDARRVCTALTVKFRLPELSSEQAELWGREFESRLSSESIWHRSLNNPYSSRWNGVVAVGEYRQMINLCTSFDSLIKKEFPMNKGGNDWVDLESQQYWSGVFKRQKELATLDEANRIYERYSKSTVLAAFGVEKCEWETGSELGDFFYQLTGSEDGFNLSYPSLSELECLESINYYAQGFCEN